MDVKHLTPFVDAVVTVLQQYGISDIKRGSVVIKSDMNTELDITSVMSFIGGIRGNVSYSISAETAARFLSFLSPARTGLPIGTEARISFGDVTEMIMQKASEFLLQNGILITPSQPTVVSGQEMFFAICPVQTIAVNIGTSFGGIEINIGLEE